MPNDAQVAALEAERAAIEKERGRRVAGRVARRDRYDGALEASLRQLVLGAHHASHMARLADAAAARVPAKKTPKPVANAQSGPRLEETQAPDIESGAVEVVNAADFGPARACTAPGHIDGGGSSGRGEKGDSSSGSSRGRGSDHSSSASRGQPPPSKSSLAVGLVVEVRDGDNEWAKGTVEEIGDDEGVPRPRVRKEGYDTAYTWDEWRFVKGDSHAAATPYVDSECGQPQPSLAIGLVVEVRDGNDEWAKGTVEEIEDDNGKPRPRVKKEGYDMAYTWDEWRFVPDAASESGQQPNTQQLIVGAVVEVRDGDDNWTKGTVEEIEDDEGVPRPRVRKEGYDTAYTWDEWRFMEAPAVDTRTVKRPRAEAPLSPGAHVEVRDGDNDWVQGVVEAIPQSGYGKDQPLIKKRGSSTAHMWDEWRYPVPTPKLKIGLAVEVRDGDDEWERGTVTEIGEEDDGPRPRVRKDGSEHGYLWDEWRFLPLATGDDGDDGEGGSGGSAVATPRGTFDGTPRSAFDGGEAKTVEVLHDGSMRYALGQIPVVLLSACIPRYFVKMQQVLHNCNPLPRRVLLTMAAANLLTGICPYVLACLLAAHAGIRPHCWRCRGAGSGAATRGAPSARSRRRTSCWRRATTRARAGRVGRGWRGSPRGWGLARSPWPGASALTQPTPAPRAGAGSAAAAALPRRRSTRTSYRAVAASTTTTTTTT